MIKIIQEFHTTDGIGAMLWKKIYAMCYAYKYKMLFKDRPFNWFLIHPSDHADDERIYYDILYKFNHILYNPWKNINFDSFEWELSDQIGQGAPAPGFADHHDFLLEAPVFNKNIQDNSNSVVIHMRRGNAVQHNPRFTHETVYVNILNQIDSICSQLDITNPRVILLTDAPDYDTSYMPSKYDMKQYNMWHQPWLDKNENGEWPLVSIDWKLIVDAYPPIIIENKLSTYESFMLMLNAKLLIPAYSAFSQSAGLLTHNKVLAWPPKEGMDDQMNLFRNNVGFIDMFGNISLK